MSASLRRDYSYIKKTNALIEKIDSKSASWADLSFVELDKQINAATEEASKIEAGNAALQTKYIKTRFESVYQPGRPRLTLMLALLGPKPSEFGSLRLANLSSLRALVLKLPGLQSDAMRFTECL